MQSLASFMPSTSQTISFMRESIMGNTSSWPVARTAGGVPIHRDVALGPAFFVSLRLTRFRGHSVFFGPLFLFLLDDVLPCRLCELIVFCGTLACVQGRLACIIGGGAADVAEARAYSAENSASAADSSTQVSKIV